MGDESWITVKKGGRRKVGNPSTPVPKSIMSTDTAKRKNPSEVDVSDLEKSLREYSARFKKSSDRDAVMRTLEKEVSKRDGVTIDTAVCLALGAPSEEVVGSLVRSRWQFAAFLEMVELLETLRGKHEDEKETRHSIKLIVQDPRFEELDRQVLRRFGAQVTEDPAANEFITETSFLYAPFMDINVLLENVLPGKDPAVYIGPSKLESVNYGIFTWSNVEKMKSTAEEFLEDRVEFLISMPRGDLDTGTSFLGLSVYLRSIEDDEDDE
jgi:hypothetical protein